MDYLYYPGCSLKSTGRAYEESMLSVFRKLDLAVMELEDWNCCGATAYMSISELKAFALSARNFALAEAQCKELSTAELVVPCAACYLCLNKARRYLDEHEELREKINRALQTANLDYHNRTRIRHPLDVLANDLRPEKIKDAVVHSLSGIKVACYYGCQIVRPYADFDDQKNPHVMDDLARLLGAEPISWPLKTRCCGGSLMGTAQDVGLRLSFIILKEAVKRGCHAVITACPLCQFNLECYQPKMSNLYGESVNIPVLYFTQLMGMAFGISERELGLQRNFNRLDTASLSRISAGGEHVGI